MSTRQYQITGARSRHEFEPNHVRTLAAWLCAGIIAISGCGAPPQTTASGDVNATSAALPQPEASVSAPLGAPAAAEQTPPVPAPPQPTKPTPAVAIQVQETPAIKLRAEAVEQPLAKIAVVAPKVTSSEQTAPKQPEKQKPVEEPQPAPTPAAGVNMPLLQPGTTGDPNELISVNFDNVEIRTVLKTVGEITGINFIPHSSVTGTVTVMSPTPIRLGEIYPFLQSILDVYGYATIETENAVKIVPKAEATKSRLPVHLGSDPAAIAKTDAIIRQIIPIKYADASEISDIITPILSPGAQLATYPRTNSLMITDTCANIHHIAQVIRRLDVEGAREKVRLFPLAHASAQTLSEQILRILEKTKTGGMMLPAARGPAAGAAGGDSSKVLPDDRTNSLIVIAGEQETAMIADLVRQLDIERPAGTDNVHVVYLKNADANEVSRSLERALTTMKLAGAVPAGPAQQIQVTPDGSTNSLVINAPTSEFATISQIIEKLDIVREQVLVEMLILEISDEKLRELGVDWATFDNAVANSVRGFAATNFGPRVNFLNGTAEGLSVGAMKSVGGTTKIGAILNAMDTESNINILSTPHILASNHRKARIVVGENRAFVTQSRITETTDPAQPTVIKTFEYKDVGITLDITPHVSMGGRIRLDLKTEFTKLIDDVTSVQNDTPTTAKRTASTVVTMDSGATVVIGGLIRDDTIKTAKKIPLLGDIPLLGALFQSQSNHVQKTNLLLFITPEVLTSAEELQQMTNHKKQQMDQASGKEQIKEE